MGEKISLYGGPRDSEVLEYGGGDTVEFPAAPPMIDFSVQTTDPIRHETHIYRRSLRTPSIFVFQP